ncbi:MAG: hypothetical protein CMH83_23025 [Nocardioides sp.]|nr:hypothetical protein [Nocardioides sp.]
MEEGSVMTVTGPLAAADLGLVLPHEHLIANATSQWRVPESDEDLAEQTRPYRAELHGKVQTQPFSYRSAMQQLDLDVALTELRSYAAAGGGTVVELGIPGYGRDAAALQVLSRLSGVPVVMGCGEYVAHSHSPYVRHVGAEVVRDVLIDEITVGVGATGVRAGIIGEIGSGNPVDEQELKVLDAAAMAHLETGVPINIHRSIFPDPMAGLVALDRVLDHGVDPAKVVVSHCDERPEPEFALAVAERGAWAELDTFGMEQWASTARQGTTYPARSYDHHRIDMLLRLLDAGHLDRVLLSHDIAMKPQFSAYGGWGLTHLLTNIRPQLEARGVAPAEVDRIMRDNPRRMLAG